MIGSLFFFVFLHLSFCSGTIVHVVYGDTGQINSWWLQNMKMRIAEKARSKSNDPEILTAACNYLDTISTSIQKEDVSPLSYADMYVNFLPMYSCKYNDKWDSTVLLGDGVYTEHKGGPLKLQTVPGKDDKEVTDKISPDLERHIVFKTCAEAKDLTPNFISRVRKAQEETMKMFTSSLDQKTCKADLNEMTIDIMPGNHSFDVDFASEDKIHEIFQKNIKWDEPLLQLEEKDHIRIYTLDINLFYMSCLSNTEITYPQCMLTIDNAGSSQLPTYRAAKKYAVQLIEALFELKFKTNADWRIFRSHNPVLNPEIDFNPVMMYEFTGKCSVGPKPIIKTIRKWLETSVDKSTQNQSVVCWEDPSADTASLMEIFQTSGVDFWLASHFHAGIMIAAPFSRFAKPNTLQASKYQGDFLRTSQGKIHQPTKCADRFDEFFKFIEDQNDSSPPKQPDYLQDSLLKDCKETETVNTIFIEEAGKPQHLLLEFLTGNSGRYFDPLKSDKTSNGEVIWARVNGNGLVDQVMEDINYKEFTKDNFSKQIEDIEEKLKNVRNNYGYSRVTFKKTKAIIEFFEFTENRDGMSLVKTFKLVRKNSGDLKKNYVHMIEKLGVKDFTAKMTSFLK